MITCPNCGELLGNSVNECFKCHYNFSLRKVITREQNMERRNKQIEEQKELEEKNKQIEEIKRNQLS